MALATDSCQTSRGSSPIVEDHPALPDSRIELIRVLIVDDAPETVSNLQKLLSLEGDIQVVATAQDGAEGLAIRP
jgi:hypothetical protein